MVNILHWIDFKSRRRWPLADIRTTMNVYGKAMGESEGGTQQGGPPRLTFEGGFAIITTAEAHRRAGLAAVTGEHYEGGHWLGSFAVYLVTHHESLALGAKTPLQQIHLPTVRSSATTANYLHWNYTRQTSALERHVTYRWLDHWAVRTSPYSPGFGKQGIPL